MGFYDLTFNDSFGNTIKMSDFKDKVVLIVNTATKCGLRGQFRELEEHHQKYEDKRLVII